MLIADWRIIFRHLEFPHKHAATLVHLNDAVTGQLVSDGNVFRRPAVHRCAKALGRFK
jgi:hypothetical protein